MDASFKNLPPSEVNFKTVMRYSTISLIWEKFKMVDSKTKENFPYKSDYYHLIKGKTISRRGRWWTAALLVQSVDNADKRIVVIQRWQKRNRADPDAEGKISSYWAPAKAFTIAFRGGSVMGLTVVGLNLLGISLLYLRRHHQRYKLKYRPVGVVHIILL